MKALSFCFPLILNQLLDFTYLQLCAWKVNRVVSCALFIVDEAGKMVSEDGTEVTVEGAVEDQEVEKDEDGQEVIKVYIFKADSGEDDMGELHKG